MCGKSIISSGGVTVFKGARVSGRTVVILKSFLKLLIGRNVHE